MKQRRVSRRPYRQPPFLMPGGLAWILFMVTSASAQYADWEHSGSIYILTTPEGANLPASASVRDFPLLVRLHRDHFNFSDAEEDGRPCYMVRALTRIEDFNEYFECDLTDDDYDTIGGLVMHQLGYLPRRGESLAFGGFDFRVTKADRRRIDSLQVQRDRREAATG